MRAHVFPSHERLLAPDAVILDDLLVRIGKKRERKLEFCGELLVRLQWISAYAQNDRAFFREPCVGVAEAARFFGATGSVVPGIEIEHHIFALQLGQGELTAATAVSGEIGRLVTFLQFQLQFFSHNSHVALTKSEPRKSEK